MCYSFYVTKILPNCFDSFPFTLQTYSQTRYNMTITGVIAYLVSSQIFF